MGSRSGRRAVIVALGLTVIAAGCGDSAGDAMDGATTGDAGAAQGDATTEDAGVQSSGKDDAGTMVPVDAGSPAPAPGGFLESASDMGSLDRLSADAIVGSLPGAGESFTFPAPYGTQAIRLTDASSCGGSDCLRYVGYSYWRNINNHVGSDHLLLVLGLDEDDGGTGLTLFRVDKQTLAVEDLGAALDGTGLPTNMTGEGVYFSATMPHALYVHSGGRLLRVDVMTKDVEVVFDVGPEYGEDHIVWQHHTSDDDAVHSFTLRDGSYSNVGCGVYFEDRATFRLYTPVGDFDECQLDRSGRWLVIKDDVDGEDGEDNRIIDLEADDERVLLDRDGAAGHSDMGHGYMIAADNYNGMPGAYRVWDLTMPLDAASNGTLVYHDTGWGDTGGDHVSHTNAQPGVPLDRQVACNSRLLGSGSGNPRGGEIICYRLDGSLEVLVVAPTLSERGDRDAYTAMPKGNLDVTGRWLIWTANVGGERLDAFLVRVPLERLLEE